MIVTNLSQSFEARVEGFATGLVGTVGVRLLDNIGGTTTGRSTAGISEDPAGSGSYVVTLTAPGVAGQYTVFWDDGSVSPGHVASEDLFVSSTVISVAPPLPATGGTLNLTYSDLRAAIYEARFPTSEPVWQWLAAAYGDVWNAADWTFKYVSRETFYPTADGLVGGTPAEQPKMPAAFASVTRLHDDNGSKLRELSQSEFEDIYLPASTGRPEAFCVVNRQIVLGPAPDSAYAFKLSYRRRLATRTSGGAGQAGFFQADTDLPLWDDHHYLLVLRAKLIGLRDRSDPTADELEGEFGRLLAAMKDEYVVARQGRQLPAWR